MNNKLLIFLQNAYRVELGFIPSYKRKVFRNSQAGKRLREMIPARLKFEIRNSNPEIGDKSSSNFLPDIDYIAHEIVEVKPKAILVCGKNAKLGVQQALQEYELGEIPLILAPHPTWRCLSKKHTSEIRDNIKGVIRQ